MLRSQPPSPHSRGPSSFAAAASLPAFRGPRRDCVPSIPAHTLGSGRDQKLAMGPGALCVQHKCPLPHCGRSLPRRIPGTPPGLRPQALLKARAPVALGTNHRLGWLKHALCTAPKSNRFLAGRAARVAPSVHATVALALQERRALCCTCSAATFRSRKAQTCCANGRATQNKRRLLLIVHDIGIFRQ